MNIRFILALFASIFLSVPVIAGPPTSFNSGKKAATKLWWEIGATTFYCSCPYRWATDEEKEIRKGNLWVEADQCNYEPKDPLTSAGKPNARVSRVEWEHVVPADWIATGFQCQEMTRSECRKIDGYKEAEGDLFNLVPAVGELNGDRSARLHGVIEGEEREYGTCNFEVTTEGPEEEPHLRGLAEPKEDIRGDIARIWFYMEMKYGVEIPEDNRADYVKWNQDDPVDDPERDRNEVISKKMGWPNPFVE